MYSRLFQQEQAMREPRTWDKRSTVSHVFFCIVPNPGRLVGEKNSFVMKEQNEKEGLQSRREFFRNAAKAALPVLGAIVLAGAPSIIKAAESNSQCDCSGACSGTCIGSCKGTCDGACSFTCKGSCEGTCDGACSFGCKGSNK